MDIIDTKIEFGEDDKYLRNEFVKKAHYELGAKEQGFMHSPAYKHGVWDGIIDFFDPKTDTFPTGLIELVKDILGDMQALYGFQYEIIDNRPDPFLYVEDMDKDIVLKDDKIEQITLRDYQYNAVQSIITNYTGIVNVATNGGKTEIASGIIQQIKPYLESDERVAFFTDKKEIFNQSAERISQRLGIPVGKLGGGQKDIKQVTVVMIPTINSGLKDPEKGVKLTPKERLYKKIAKEILPMFEKRNNHRDLLAIYVRNFKPKTKVDQTLLQELENVYNTCGTDSAVLMKLRNYNAKYIDTIKKKNKKTYEKYNELKDFLESVAVMICDEAHHTGSDTWYNSLRNCTNARYRVGLTGSIDKKNEVLWRRLQSLFGDIVSKIENDFLISKGYSAKPVIKMFPITSPSNIDKVSDYQPAYQQGITNNEFRNTLIAKLTKMCYNENKGILIIVNYLEHGQNISEILTRLDVDHYFVHGQLDDDTRKSKLADMKAGKLKVMIATSIIDEGVDISGINALVIAAGGKSLRQTLQRIGRALRKKDKDNTTQIFDFVDYTNKHLLKHSKERRKIYDEEKFEVVDIRPNK